jgi:hypothetical protein
MDATIAWLVHSRNREGAKDAHVGVKEQNFLYDNDLVLEVEELFYLFNQDALDKALISCYCL